jgi:hypothetical protein
MARKTARRRSMPPINIHAWLVYVAVGLIVGGAIGHLVQPNDRFWERMNDLGLAALFGKLSNGFGQSLADLMKKRRGETTDPAEPTGETEETTPDGTDDSGDH